jgi:hypothetical protein
MRLLRSSAPPLVSTYAGSKRCRAHRSVSTPSSRMRSPNSPVVSARPWCRSMTRATTPNRSSGGSSGPQSRGVHRGRRRHPATAPAEAWFPDGPGLPAAPRVRRPRRPDRRGRRRRSEASRDLAGRPSTDRAGTSTTLRANGGGHVVDFAASRFKWRPKPVTPVMDRLAASPYRLELWTVAERRRWHAKRLC